MKYFNSILSFFSPAGIDCPDGLSLLCLQNIKDILDKLGDQIAVIHEKQPDVILEASGPEAIQIGDALTQLNAEWDRINRMYNDRKW